MWSLHEDCRNLIQQSWNTNVVGCPMFILNQKLKTLKQNLKIWNKMVFGNVNILVKEAEQKLVSIQADIDINGVSDSLLDQTKNCSNIIRKCFGKGRRILERKIQHILALSRG